jgi:hypothetical protein
MKRIGFWRKFVVSKEELSWPEEGKLPLDTKQKIVDFLNKGKVYKVTRGWSNCRICGKMNGTICLKNGEFIYPEGYAHYIIDHNIMPDADLLVKVLKDNMSLNKNYE